MHRSALGLIAAVALTSLDARAQAGFVDATRLVASRPWTMDHGRGAAPVPALAAVADTSATRASGPAAAPVSDPVARTAGAPRSVPTLARKASRTVDKSPFVPQTAKERRGMKYMLVGAGVLLTGAIVDDDAGDILMIGGLVIGFYGLWIFLN